MAIVGARWAQYRRQWEGTDCGRRAGEEAEEVGIGDEQTTKGRNECGFKGPAGTREAV